MPVEQAIWRIEKEPVRLKEEALETENLLEDLITKDVSILNENWLLIGRQVATSFNNYVDLLALDAAGTVIVIELKRAKTPREVVAQAIDYASWAEKLEASDLAEIYEKFSSKYLNKEDNLSNAISNKFKSSISDDELNESHQIIVVGSELDSSTERIVQYLNDKDIPINVIFFRVFVDRDKQFLSRAWLIDPGETQQISASSSRESEPWNGEYYVSYGHDLGRNWSDAIKYGFVSAGGGGWYSRTLSNLKEGDRVWVNIPHTGYVGVGIVKDTVREYSEFKVEVDGERVPFTTVEKHSHYHEEFIDNSDKTEYFVSVEWINTIPVNQAISENGFFGNQNTVCAPTTPKWRHTVDRLKSLWNIR